MCRSSVFALTVAIGTVLARALTIPHLQPFSGPDPINLQAVLESTHTKSEVEIERTLGIKVTRCFELFSRLNHHCWQKKPVMTAARMEVPYCTLDSGTKMCLCEGTSTSNCNGDASVSTKSVKSSMCVEAEIYTRASGAREIYCKNMQVLDRWAEKGLIGKTAEKQGWFTLECDDPDYTLRDFRCTRKKRYLGDSCWDGQSGIGRCEQTADSTYSVACYDHKCIPYSVAKAKPAVACSCAEKGLNLYAACASENGVCGGHPCMMNMLGDKKYYCDFKSGQQWSRFDQVTPEQVEEYLRKHGIIRSSAVS